LDISPAGRSFAGSSADCQSSDGPSGAGWSLQRLSEAGGTLEEAPLDGRSTVIHDGVCWFSERLSKVGGPTGAIGLFAAPDREVLAVWDLRIAML
jgi:hypothetical protein